MKKSSLWDQQTDDQLISSFHYNNTINEPSQMWRSSSLLDSEKIEETHLSESHQKSEGGGNEVMTQMVDDYQKRRH